MCLQVRNGLPLPRASAICGEENCASSVQDHAKLRDLDAEHRRSSRVGQSELVHERDRGSFPPRKTAQQRGEPGWIELGTWCGTGLPGLTARCAFHECGHAPGEQPVAQAMTA